MGSLLPSNDSAPKFAQLYIYDLANEVSNQMSQFPHSTSDSSLDETIVADLIEMLASTNCLVGLFRHAAQKLSEPGNPGYKLQLLGQRTTDSKQYNDPTSDDIGGLIVGDIGDYRSERDIIIESSSCGLQRISKLHPKFMALQYPLLFPFGEDEREYGEDTLIKGGRLYQQFLVDAFANIGEDRLDYIRMNQNDLRYDLYHNITEAVLKGDVQGSSTGKIILPSSVTGSPRAKLLDMLKFIKSGAPFGKTIADVHAIEFQKRGLPHTHILVWLASEYKFRTSADIDSIVSTEIPDRNIDPLCHEIVSKFMIHGPCGVARPSAQCMSGNVVSKMPNLILADDQLKNYVLYELEQLFNASATTLQDHSLHMPDGQLLTEIANKLLREELNYDLAELRMASSGIASLLPNGRTAHSRFKIPLSIDESSTCAIKKNTHLSNLLQKTSLIVWDEAPMINRCCFEALDRSMRDVLSECENYNKDLPFGGKTILLGGDFRQILPVIPDGTKEQIINASLTSSKKAEITEFSEWILNVGNGQISNLASLDESDDSFVSIPSDLLLENSCEPISTTVSTIYPTICDIQVDPGYFRERVIVTTKNTAVAEINDFVLNIAPGEKHVYLSVDSIYTSSTESDDANSLYPIEYNYQLEFNGVPSHQLALKVGTPVMLLRNISPSMGLCNGTRLIITQLSSKVIQAQIITGSNIGNQASAKGRNIQPFAASIIEGDYYEVCGFYTFENRYTNSVVAHEAVIDLKSDTKVTRIDPMTPPIPRHYFTFIDFAHLLTTGKRSGVLTGFIAS
uniref:ATP-dependent DNA helicase n=1 Tax=Salix viminalis TaxID=40686 RepID=A0A6N2LTF1_SALVM